jgi:hypothetical protein
MEDDECVGNDITYIAEALGPMPKPTPRLFDIYLQEKTLYNVMPNRYLYDDNAGRGYTDDQARARVAELNAMSIGNLTFTKRLRNMPKPDEPLL